MGKGSTQRPCLVDREEALENNDRVYADRRKMRPKRPGLTKYVISENGTVRPKQDPIDCSQYTDLVDKLQLRAYGAS